MKNVCVRERDPRAVRSDTLEEAGDAEDEEAAPLDARPEAERASLRSQERVLVINKLSYSVNESTCRCGLREFLIDNLLVRIHVIIVMIRRTGLAPWEFEFSALASRIVNITLSSASPRPEDAAHKGPVSHSRWHSLELQPGERWPSTHQVCASK